MATQRTFRKVMQSIAGWLAGAMTAGFIAAVSAAAATHRRRRRRVIRLCRPLTDIHGGVTEHRSCGRRDASDSHGRRIHLRRHCHDRRRKHEGHEA